MTDAALIHVSLDIPGWFFILLFLAGLGDIALNVMLHWELKKFMDEPTDKPKD